MKIDKIDPNFKVETAKIEENDIIYTLPCKEISLYGTIYDYDIGCFQRMDHEVAKSIDYNKEVLSSTTAGARAKFCTNAREITLSVKYRYLVEMSTMPKMGASGFTLFENDGTCNKYVAYFMPVLNDKEGFVQTKKLKGGEMREYILYFPLYNDYITEVSLSFNKEAVVKPGKKYRGDLPILYYGSSITQGGCASRPDNCYQAYISIWNDYDYLNLGFSGGAKGEDEMIEYLSNIKSKVFVCDYDHNAPTTEHLKNTHYKLYRAYRDKNPNTPIIFMTMPNVERPEATPNRRVIKATYTKAKRDGDDNVYFIDGRKLFGREDREHCTTDLTHPNDLGFYRMAKVLNRVIAPLLKD